MKVEPPPPGDQDEGPSALELALEALLTGKVRVRLDPTSGQIVSTSDGERFSLTDAREPPTIP